MQVKSSKKFIKNRIFVKLKTLFQRLSSPSIAMGKGHLFPEWQKCLFEHKIIHYLLSVYIELSITTECLVSYAQNGLFEMILSSRFYKTFMFSIFQKQRF